MDNSKLNPYQAPQADLADAANDYKFSEVLERKSVLLVILLNFVTLYIYSVYWLYTRTKRINTITKQPINNALIYSTLVSFFLSFIFGFLAEFSSSSFISISAIAIQVINVILLTVWNFKLRNRILAFGNKNHERTSILSILLTFFLSTIYLQYKVNQQLK